MVDMSIFVDTDYEDEAAFKDFLLANSQSHSQNAKKMQNRGLAIIVYPISDMGDNEQQWLSDHAAIHSQEFSQIGLVGLPDLEDIDLSDKQQYHDWQVDHALVHLAVNEALGIV